jgi:tetratricopeptide (TPR) repeat protein
MGFLDLLLGSKVSNPALVAVMETLAKNPSDEHIADLWQKLLKAKVLLATTQEGKEGFKRVKQPKEAVGIVFTTVMKEKNEADLAVFTDNAALEAFAPGSPFVIVSGEDAFAIATGKNYNGLVINPNSAQSANLRLWQHSVFIDKVSEATKLQAIASKFTRLGNHADAEGVLKAAISCSQRDPGPQHPFTAELNLELARAMRGQGKLNDSEWVYRRALQIYEVAGSCELEVAGVSEALGSLYIENHKASQSAPLLVRALEIYENVPGSKPDNVSRILCQLAELKRDDEPAEAEQYYKRASVMLEERKQPEALTILNKAASLLEKMDKPKDALHSYQRAVTLNQTIKRCREFDIAFASHRMAAIQIAIDEVKDAQALLEKALDLYKRDGGGAENIAAVEKLMEELKAKEQKQQEEDEQKKSRFGGPGKRPADLPLLDMSQVKNNPKATITGAPARKEPEKEATPEDAALEAMKAFLDNVDTKPVKREEPKAKEEVAPEPKAEPAPEEAAIIEAIVAAQEKEQEHFEAVKLSDLKLKLDEVKREEPKVEKVEEAEEPPVAPVAEEKEDDVTSLFEKPVDADISGVFNRSVVGKIDKDDRYDKPIGERLKEEAKPVVEPVAKSAPEPVVEPAAKSEPEPAVEAAAKPEVEEKKGLFDQQVDGEISMFFNRSVLNDIKKDERFDKPIAKRQEEPVQETAAQAAQREEEEAEAEAALFKEEELDDSLGDAFASLLADPKKAMGDDRFDKPIAERLKEATMPPAAPPKAEKPVPKPPEKPMEKSAQDALFDGDDLEDSLGGAFASILADPSKADDRFSKPIARAAEPAPEPKIEPKAEPKADEASVEELLREGTQLVQQQKLDEAIKIFDKVTRMSPNDIKAWYCKGSSLHLKNQFEDALYCFNHVLNLDTDNAKAMLRKAECLSKLGRADQCIVIYDRLLVLQPKLVSAWLSKARALLQQRKLKEALDCYQQALTLEPGNEEATKAKNLIAAKLGVATAN